MRSACVVLFGWAVLPLLVATPALACDCHDGGLACEAFWKSPVVFVGRVESVSPINGNTRSGPRVRTRFRVTEALRGTESREIDIFGYGTSCDLQFFPGEDWIIYAFSRSDGQGLSTGTCSRSRPLQFAEEDVNYARSTKFAAPPKGRILGTVMYRGAQGPVPVKGARMTFHGPASLQLSAATGPDGAYEVAAPAGVYRVSTALPPGMFAHSLAPPLVNLVDNRACAVADVFAEFPATIRGRVVDARNGPVANLTVELIRLDQYQYPPHHPRAVTDAAGNFLLDGVEPGRYAPAIVIGHDRTLGGAEPRFMFSNGETRRDRARGLDAMEGTTGAAGTIVLPEAIRIGRIAGVVQFGDGMPAAGIKVAMKLDVDGDGLPWTTISTDREGRFEFGVVAGLTYRVVAQSTVSNATRRASVNVDPSKPAHTIRLILP